MSSTQTLFLLDASSYLFRAYYAIGHLSNSKGMSTNAIYGFTQMLLRLIKDYTPDHLVAVWDRPEPTFRKQQFEAYKAQRKEIPADLPEQIDWIKKILEGFKIPSLEKAGFEADDIIGTLAHKMEAQGLKVVIVTGDKDLMQLVNEKITLLDTMKERKTNIEGVIARFGVPPHQVIDVLGLAGDSSDNIPGVPGIGEKTATTLIQQFGSIENLYERLSELKGKRKETLEQNRDLAFLSKKLVTIDCAVPIEYRFEDFLLESPDHEKLSGIFHHLEFSKLLDQFQLRTTAHTASQTSTAEYICVQSDEAFRMLLQDLVKSEIFAFDTETTSLKVQEAELVGLSFSTQAGKGYYLPLGHHTEELQLSREHVLHELKPILESTHPLKIAQNFKYDYQILKMQGIEVKGLCSDTMIASYLLDPAASHNMDAIAKKYLDYQCVSFEEITQGGKFNFSQISLADATRYSAEDAEVTFRLYQHLNPLIQKNHLEKLQNEIEVPLSKVLANMELSGIKIDREFLKSLQSEFKQRLEVLDKKIIECAGEPFNINSTKQLATILFEKLKLPAKKKTKTGFSTDVDVLTDLAKMHELPAQILLYRGLAKLKSTYVDALLETADLKTDRVHTSFNQTIAETGRLSSTDPNLQNIPIRSEEGKKIRRAFIAEKGFQLLSADYSQIELRILAHFSQDEHLVKAMNEGIDIHRLTAASLFKLDPSQVSSDMRAIGKTVNFGVIYGQTAFGLSQQLSISPATAKEYIDHYFAQYPGVQVFREKVLSEARENGFVRTLYGRWRQVQDIHNKNQNVKAFAERMAFNTVIQGSAADLIKLAMIRIENEILKQKLQSKMLLQVHDELIFEVEENEIDLMKELILYQMKHAILLSVDLEVEIGMGSSWAEAH